MSDASKIRIVLMCYKKGSVHFTAKMLTATGLGETKQTQKVNLKANLNS